MDKVSKEVRSKTMAAVRSSGNRSTERRLRSSLAGAGITGWKLQARNLRGRPDFVFFNTKVALFVDGCFWHGCPRCYRRPGSSQDYWDKKVLRNMARDKATRQELRRLGWLPIRIWEHSLRSLPTVRRIILAAIAFQNRRNC